MSEEDLQKKVLCHKSYSFVFPNTYAMQCIKMLNGLVE